MTAALLALNVPETPDPQRILRKARRDRAASASPLLNQLRWVGLRCRSARRAPPIEACQLISGERSGEAALHLLMRSLPQALGHMPRFFAPGVTSVSGDEAWLLAMFGALARGDTDSSAFLLRSRVPAPKRRGLMFLLRAAQAANLPTA